MEDSGGNSKQATVIVRPSSDVTAVVTGTIGALKDSPNLLMVFLLNVMFISALFYFLLDKQRREEQIIDTMLSRCTPDQNHVGVGGQ